jgi:hypothetical protein
MLPFNNYTCCYCRFVAVNIDALLRHQRKGKCAETYARHSMETTATTAPTINQSSSMDIDDDFDNSSPIDTDMDNQDYSSSQGNIICKYIKQ